MRLFVSKKIHQSGRGEEIDDAVLTVTEEEAARLEWPLQRHWFLLFSSACFLVLFFFGYRAFSLSILDNEKYDNMAARNSLREIVLPAPRGMILDRNGSVLVQNVPAMDLVVIPADIPKEEVDRESIAKRLQEWFSVEPEAFFQALQSSKLRATDPVLLKEHVSQEESLLLVSRSKELPGVSLYQSAKREYVDGLIFSHVLGYEGKIRSEELVVHPEYLLTDSIGKQGIEKSYESVLRGTHGARRVLVDSLGRPQKELGILEPKPGKDILLSIDSGLQKKIFDSLQGLLEKKNLRRAAAIAMNPENGQILSLVSLPSYDNNLFAGGISGEEYKKLSEDPAEPLFNRAISGAYPPGSTIKPVIAAAALSEHIISDRTEIESRGGISVGKFFFGDWKVHGFTDLRRAIAVSSDVYFYTVGGGYGGVAGLGMERMKKYEKLFGYGEESGIDLPGEVSGFLPDPEWKKRRFGERWYIGDDYHAAIGQGYVLATPIQVLNAVSAIANGGTLFSPRIGMQIRSENGSMTSIVAPVLRKNFINSDILQVVREGMRETVTEGTAQVLKDLPIPVSGKTGTAQFGNGKDTHGWFVSYAPSDKPQIAMIVLVEGQDEEGYNAVPVTHEVFQWYFSQDSFKNNQ